MRLSFTICPSLGQDRFLSEVMVSKGYSDVTVVQCIEHVIKRGIRSLITYASQPSRVSYSLQIFVLECCGIVAYGLALDGNKARRYASYDVRHS